MGDEVVDQQWESQAEVDACLLEIGRTMDQVRRWRREGLLPAVKQVSPDAYRGSETRYPSRTCAQIRAASALFQKKNRVEFVGRHLWLMGYEVDEKYWRPQMRRWAGNIDRVTKFLRWFDRRLNRNYENPTLADIIGARDFRNIIFSRINGRVKADERATFMRVVIEIETGEFSQFEPQIDAEIRSTDEIATIDAFDISASENDKILGQEIGFVKALPFALRFLSEAMSKGSFMTEADGPKAIIDGGRNDLMNALQIGRSMYEALHWIYREEAFGLRLAHWVAIKAPGNIIDGMILVMARLRQIPGAILPSDEIAKMAADAQKMEFESKQLRHLWASDAAADRTPFGGNSATAAHAGARRDHTRKTYANS